MTGGEGLIGVIPAAGRSSRIGGNPKPLLDTGSGTFLECTVRALAGGGAESVHVGVRHETGPVSAAVQRLGARPHVPPEVEDGPIATIRTVIRTLRAEGSTPAAILFLPVDIPGVTAGIVRALVQEWKESDARLVLPAHRGRTGHPALFSGVLLDELLEPDLAEGARTIVERHRTDARIVEIDDEGILIDIDTLPEYRRRFPEAYRKRFQKW
ncbi:MAG: hypothetical protein EA351_05070 [Gemmatimonadales bacterium]|nr:MAG: hypothetical protein EA351_05070 [Gemmatimonadales bacterium]